MNEKIVLIGYKCSGKSTIGKELAKELNYEFIDTDEYADGMIKIAFGIDMNIGDFIRKFGIDEYRKIEKSIIEGLMEWDRPIVISTGGGLPINTMDFLNEHCITVYLRVSIDELFNRIIKANNENRPSFDLLNDNEIMMKIIEEMSNRNPIYMQSKIIISDDNLLINKLKTIINHYVI